MEYYPELAIVLLLLGLLLLVAEIFIPSGGTLLGGSLICLGFSVYFAWKAWWGSSPVWWWVYIGSALVLLPTVTSLALYIFPRTSMGKQVLLEAPSAERLSTPSKEEQRLLEAVGRIGRTVTPLTPGGLVQVDSHRFHCFSEGLIIDRDELVEIVAVRGPRLLVRKAAVSAESQKDKFVEEAETAEERVDFDFSDE